MDIARKQLLSDIERMGFIGLAKLTGMFPEDPPPITNEDDMPEQTPNELAEEEEWLRSMSEGVENGL